MFPRAGKKKNNKNQQTQTMPCRYKHPAQDQQRSTDLQIPRNNWIMDWCSPNKCTATNICHHLPPHVYLQTNWAVESKSGAGELGSISSRNLESVLQSMLPGLCVHLTLKLCGFSGDKHSSHSKAKVILSLWTSPWFSLWRKWTWESLKELKKQRSARELLLSPEKPPKFCFPFEQVWYSLCWGF